MQPGLPETITFYDFICKEVEVRFALVNQHGISGFSPPFNMHIQGGNLRVLYLIPIANFINSYVIIKLNNVKISLVLQLSILN